MAAAVRRLAIDIMGGDSSPEELLAGLIDVIPALAEGITIYVLIAADHVSAAMLASAAALSPRLEIVTAPSAITVDDEPLTALRRKPESTLIQGVIGLAEGQWDALISCGNTGALIAAVNMRLPKLAAVRRPALLAPLPLPGGDCLLLDVGATTHPTTELLAQHALLGARYWRALYPERGMPRLALLNIGQETHKGTSLLRNLHYTLKMAHNGEEYRFIGNVEGRFLTDGSADIVLTDGFTGNVFLKAVEGAFLFFLQVAAKRLTKDGISHDSLLERLKHFHYLEHPGALVAGSRSLVIKCHGAATSSSLSQALLYAEKLLRQGVMQRLVAQP